MKRLKQRLISWILAVVMILGMIPANVFAETATGDDLTEPELIVFTADGEEVEVKELTTSGNYSIQLQKGTDIVISSGVGKITNILKLEPEINENGEAAVSSDDLEALTIEAMGMPPEMIESIKQDLMNNEGLVMTDISNELATLSIAIEGIDYTRELYVELLPEKIPVTAVELNEEGKELPVGGEFALSAKIAPSNATNQEVVWASSNESVATVSDGHVVAVGAGECEITATVDGITATCVVSVFDTTEELHEVTVNVAPSTAEVTFYDGSDTTKALTTEVKDNGVVDKYHQYILTVPEGKYTYRGVDGETDLGGMTFDVPFDEEIMSDGTASGEGLKFVLRRVNYYTTNKAITAVGDYTLRLIPGIMPEPVNGTQYIDENNRVVTPVLMMARGNAITYQQHITINGNLAEDYAVAPVSNVTFGEGTSALNKTFSVASYVYHTVIAPQGAEVKVFNQINNFNVEEVTNRTVSEPDADGMITYVYKTTGGSNLTYRVSMEGKITRAGYFSSKAETVTVTFEENENPKTTELKLDNANIQKRMESSTMLNVNGQNNLSLGIGDTYRLRAYRGAWQIINTDTMNIMIEPDFHYNVISGGEHISIDVVDDVCTGNATGNWMDIKGVSEGVAIVEICYDAIQIGGDGTTYDGLYGATDPQRKSLVVIQVGGAAKTLKMYADGRVNAWDTEFDTVYFMEDTGSLTFTAALGESAPDSVELSTDNGKTWSTVIAADGKYTANGLVGGNNVLRFTKGDTVEYQVVRAAKVTRTITNLTRSEGIIAGDQLKVVYSGLYTPIAKISGIYNPGFGQGHKVTYTVPEGFAVAQKGGQYDFISTNEYTITIPETASGEYTFSDGYVYFNVMGVADPLGGHRILTDAGCGTNFSAVSTMHERSVLPDLTFTVMEMPAVDVSVSADAEGAAVVIKDSTGTELTPENGVYKGLGLGTFTYVASLDGYITARGSFTVTLEDAEAKTKTVAITMRKVEGAIWDGTTKTEPSKDENGTYLIGTGAELAWFAANHGGANAILTADISLGGFQWTPVTAYAGTFDGNGHWVTDLYIDTTSETQGLFGQLNDSGVIKNLGVRGQITSTGNYIGGIVGSIRKNATISNCVSDVVVNGGRYVGGIVGQQYAGSIISNCYNLNMVTATHKSGNAGGISGGYALASQTYTIENCYNIGTVTAAKNYGSIAYTTNKANIVNSYYVGNNGTSSFGTAETEDTLKGMAETLGDAYAADTSNINGGYPVLTWQLPADIAVTGVTLDQEAVELEIGATATLKATVTPEDATDKTVTWTSSDEAVATVKDGVVTAVKAGTATITAKAGEFEATCVVTVKPEKIPVTSIELSLDGKEIVLGGEFGLSATITPSNATNQEVVWASSDETVATIDANGGAVKTVGVGECDITATADGVTVTCHVVVLDPVEVFHNRFHFTVDGVELTPIHTGTESCITQGTQKHVFEITVPADASKMNIVFDGTFMSVINEANKDKLGTKVTEYEVDLTAGYEKLCLKDNDLNVRHHLAIKFAEPETYEVTIPEDAAYTVTGAKTAIAGEDYKFTVELSAGYQAGENFAVKVNGEAAKVGANGNYVVEDVSEALTITVEGVEEIIVEPVKVYFSISDDAGFVVGKDSDEVMALKEIEVPYFDLSLYGMENFYFQSESYSDDGDGLPGSSLEPGTAQFAYGKTTVLHLYIYATEVFYCGIEPENAGKGYLYNENLIGTSTFSYSGSVGSIYFTQLWGMDENMNYYVNYEYPLASEGWGSTADQILLREGDIITVGHFSEWNFYNDPASVFNYIKAGEETVVTSAVQGDKIELSVYLAGADKSGKYSTEHTPVTTEPEVFYISVDELSEGDVTVWNSIGYADANGNITFDTTNLKPGQYIVAVSGQYGEDLTESICSAPGAILLTVEKSTEPDYIFGDVDMDGDIDTADADLVISYYYEEVELNDTQWKLADVDKDGDVDTADAGLIVSCYHGSIESFN